MFRRSLAFALFVVALTLGLSAATALAAGGDGWPLDSAAAVMLGYGAPWSTDASRTHRGVDLRASEGDSVLAPAEARVAFAGLIPCEGGRVGAVTLELSDGRRMTLMPLDGVAVTAGQRIGAGAPLGVVAADGDRSIVAAHLHVSMRRGDTYLDPMSLLVPPMAPTGDAAGPRSEPVATGESASAGKAVQSGVRVVDAGAAAAASVVNQEAPSDAGVMLSADAAPAASSAPVAPRTQAAAPPVSSAGPAPSVLGAATDLSAPVRNSQPTSSGFQRLPVDFVRRAFGWVQVAAARVLFTMFLLLMGLGLLWPLWRRSTDGEPVGVTAGGDDVAAAVSR